MTARDNRKLIQRWVSQRTVLRHRGRLAMQSLAYDLRDFPLVACELHRIRDREKPIERASIASQKLRA